MLNEEESSDKQLRAQFGERWSRTQSEQLTVAIRAEASKYRTIINNAISADSIVRERFNKHKDCIELLSKSEVRWGGGGVGVRWRWGGGEVGLR